MKRIHLLVPGTAALFVLAGCQPAQNGGTGATPSGMPDTMMTDTTTTDTMAAAAQLGFEKIGVVALEKARPQE